MYCHSSACVYRFVGHVVNDVHIPGSGPIWLDRVVCPTTSSGLCDADLSRCSHRGWGVHDCSHYEDVYIACYQRTTTDRPYSHQYPRNAYLPYQRTTFPPYQRSTTYRPYQTTTYRPYPASTHRPFGRTTFPPYQRTTYRPYRRTSHRHHSNFR